MKNQGKQNTNSTDFRIVWKVNATASARGSCVEFNTWGSHTIDWGDGCTEQVKDKYRGLKHTYVKKGEYTVSIGPGVTRCCLSQGTAEKLIEIKQWGVAQWENMESMFRDTKNMICTATDAPDLSKVLNMSHMFSGCHKFNSPIEHWDTKRVKDMSFMLSYALMFNQPLAKMDLKAVKQTMGMLEDTPAFNQDLRDLNIAEDNLLFGWRQPLAQYNLEHGERYAAQDEKQDVYSVLDGAAPVTVREPCDRRECCQHKGVCCDRREPCKG